MIVEVCAFSLESCRNAQAAGAGRIELCSGPGEGGTTPSAGLIQAAKKVVSIPVYVMIRPRGGDFVYTDDELEVMKADITAAKSLGADGLVMGVLREDGTVDRERTNELIRLARPLGVTFHRAFDWTPDPFEAMEAIIASGAERILTSGQQNTAAAGSVLLEELVKRAGKRIELMAGAGVNRENARRLAATGVDGLHLTGKAFRRGKQRYFAETVSMAGEQPDEKSILYSDRTIIQQVINELQQ